MGADGRAGQHSKEELIFWTKGGCHAPRELRGGPVSIVLRPNSLEIFLESIRYTLYYIQVLLKY